jgi:hypothetical protein
MQCDSKFESDYRGWLSGTLNTAKDNGNLQSQTITVPGLADPFVQTYI